MAFKVVTVSKQVLKLTAEARVPFRVFLAEETGLLVTQARLEVITHRTLSLCKGLKE
jgi:hypothetical protein